MIGTRSNPRETHQPLVRLNGERVTLRPPADGDYDEWEEVRRVNYDYLRPFEPRWPEDCLTKSFYRRRLSRQLSDWREDRCYSFLIFEKGENMEEGRLAGGMNINNVTRGAAHFASVGYWIAQEFQGRRFMQESLLLTLSYGFNGLRLHRFNASCVPHNKRSRAVLERVGFKQEGYATKYLQIDGIWQDHYLFGINVEDWQAALEIE